MFRTFALTALALACCTATAADWTLVQRLELPATMHDAVRLKKGTPDAANLNRFGFFSDLVYDAKTDAWFALSDRGPGGGLIDYATRVQRLRIPYDATTGAIGTPIVERTILFSAEDGQVFNGLNPQLLNNNVATLGMSFDPEGLAVGKGGHFFIADEYGPSVYEFTASGQFVRAFEVPANLVPRTPAATRDYVNGRPVIVQGRQDNRGYEGLTFNASGDTLFAVMQDPLVAEGASADGRRSRNVRIVAFDVATGVSTAQYVYRLEPIATLNALDPSTDDDFSATNQGRSIGVSAIHALSDTDFLVLERDNRGLGVEVTAKPLHKRIYRISIAGATNVANLPLTSGNDLPAGVNAVSKAEEVDVLAQLRAAGATDIPEKLEGLAIGPRLADGRRLVLVGSDNDYSVTQTGAGEQFEVCVNRTTGARVSDVPLDGACPVGMQRIQGTLLAFAVDFGG